jgi:hypothetical protein
MASNNAGVSERKRSSNSQNAKKSTGPRSSHGKAISSKNALRHGLAVANACHLPLYGEVVDLATVICGEFTDLATCHFAQDVADATIHLREIQKVRANIIGSALYGAEAPATINQMVKMTNATAAAGKGEARVRAAIAKTEAGLATRRERELAKTGPARLIYWQARLRAATPSPEDETGRLARAAAEMLKLERYERRALSRRKTALRQLATHMQETADFPKLEDG